MREIEEDGGGTNPLLLMVHTADLIVSCSNLKSRSRSRYFIVFVTKKPAQLNVQLSEGGGS